MIKKKKNNLVKISYFWFCYIINFIFYFMFFKFLMFDIEISRFCVKGVYYKVFIKFDRYRNSRKIEVLF